MINKGKLAAIKLRDNIGIIGPDEMPVEDVIAGMGGYIRYESMGKTDGRIVYGDNISTIFINSDIQYEGRKHFALAHELGHLVMHRGSAIHEDNLSLEWFNSAEKQLKKGKQEYEANQFASEYLMPSNLFRQECKGRKFGPNLIKELSDKFRTSLTSVAFRYFDTGFHPLALFHIFDGKVKYWKKSDALKEWIIDISKLPPPEDSVATEYIEADYEPIYRRNELQQEISRSTYFEIRENQLDSVFFEYCIATKAHKSILSIVWED